MKRRLRKTVKWTLTVLAALTLVAWVGSCWWLVGSLWKWGETGISVGLAPGQVYIVTARAPPSGPNGLLEFDCELISSVISEPDVYWWSEYDWWFQYEDWGSKWQRREMAVPLWFPFLLLAAPAGWLWWRGDRRRFPETACQSCGYDLSGAPHERCPECGKEIQAESPRTVL